MGKRVKLPSKMFPKCAFLLPTSDKKIIDRSNCEQNIFITAFFEIIPNKLNLIIIYLHMTKCLKKFKTSMSWKFISGGTTIHFKFLSQNKLISVMESYIIWKLRFQFLAIVYFYLISSAHKPSLNKRKLILCVQAGV